MGLSLKVTLVLKYWLRQSMRSPLSCKTVLWRVLCLRICLARALPLCYRLGLGLSDQVLTLGPSALNGDKDCSDEMWVCGSRAVL